MNDGKPFLTLEGVSLRLHEGVVFEDTHWEILQGQQWAVLGPNGSGKSVLVKALLGKVPVVSGQIRYHFLEGGPVESPFGAPEGLRNLTAFVSSDSGKTALGQASGFYQIRWNSFCNTDSPKVSQYLFPKPAVERPAFEAKEPQAHPARFAAGVEGLAPLLGIGDLLDKRMTALSDGELRRVMIAEALSRGPRLLILENPFTGLDATYKVGLRKTIEGGMERDTLVILVTTRAEEIPDSVTHVLLVDRNRVMARGPKKEVLSRHFPRKNRGPLLPKEFRAAGHPEGGAKEKASRGPTLFRLQKVCVSYEGTPILNKVTWEVRKGEHWALLGPNGAGKTTLLSLILGDNPQAYANRIVLFGKQRGSGETIWDIKRRVGWVSPELHLHYPRRISCLDVVCSGFFDSVGLYRRVAVAQRKSAEALLRHLEMADWGGEAFESLSYGEQRMILLARALVKRPPLLVLDEPCQGLDGHHRRRFLKRVDALGRKEETTIVYVTHEWDELPRVLTHAVVLGKGTIVLKGRIAKVLNALTGM